MKSFQTILDPPDHPRSPRSSTINIHEQLSLSTAKFPAQQCSPSPAPAPALDSVLWEKVWQTWCHIGREAVSDCLPSVESLQQFISRTQTQESIDSFFKGRPTQEFLVNFLRLFPVILGRMKQRFSHQELQKACQILYSSVLVPIPKDISPFLVPSVSEDNTSRLQRLVLECLAYVFTTENVLEQNLPTDSSEATSILRKVELTDLNRTLDLHPASSFQPLVPHLFPELLRFAKLAWSPPELTSVCQKSGIPPAKLPANIVNMVPFGLSCLVLTVQLYRSCLSRNIPIPTSVTVLFLKVRISKVPVSIGRFMFSFLYFYITFPPLLPPLYLPLPLPHPPIPSQALHKPLKCNFDQIQESVHSTSLQALLIILQLSLPSVVDNGKFLVCVCMCVCVCACVHVYIWMNKVLMLKSNDGTRGWNQMVQFYIATVTS